MSDSLNNLTLERLPTTFLPLYLPSPDSLNLFKYKLPAVAAPSDQMVAMSQPWLSSWLFLGNLDHLGRGEETESSHKVGEQQREDNRLQDTAAQHHTHSWEPGNIAIICRCSVFVFCVRSAERKAVFDDLWISTVD